MLVKAAFAVAAAGPTSTIAPAGDGTGSGFCTGVNAG
jgi:hypothetical protein